LTELIIYQRQVPVFKTSIVHSKGSAPHVLSPYCGGGFEYLNNPDSYAGWSIYTPVRAIQARKVEG